MERVAVVAKLKPNCADRARELVEEGPPFDPIALELERHSVFLSEEQAVFVFEGPRVNTLFRMVAEAGTAAGAFARWERILDGIPRLTREVWSWERDRAPAAVGGREA
ncbi:MAG: hypothetical protein ICV74_08925 [Thermoleophilia bacterium]|nr:hypothetical protein [Thermoleophilia bacterium]